MSRRRAFYRRIFKFELRGDDFEAPGNRPAFIDMGDQFIALMPGRKQKADDQRHFGLVVDDRSRVRELAKAAGATLLDGAFLDFLDPWGNRIQVVEYGTGSLTPKAKSVRGRNRILRRFSAHC
jgi:hypothetical protein